MIAAGAQVFSGCRALEAFRSGAGGVSGRAAYKGAEVHVKLPDAPKCPIGPAAREKGAAGRVKAFEAYVARWQRRLEVLGRCTVRDYLIPTTEIVLLDASPRMRRVALISPFQDGLALATNVASKLSRDDKLAFSVSALVQLDHLHEAGLIHSDIKAPNCMVLRRDGTTQARLLDFDGSYFADASPMPEAYTFDPYYAPAEVIRYLDTGNPDGLSGKVDVYALAVLLAELWAGERMPGLGKGALKYPADLLASGRLDPVVWLSRRGVEASMADVLSGMLAVEPAARLDAAEASRRLAEAFRPPLLIELDGGKPPAACAGGPARSGGWRGGLRKAVETTAAGAALVVAGMKGLADDIAAGSDADPERVRFDEPRVSSTEAPLGTPSAGFAGMKRGLRDPVDTAREPSGSGGFAAMKEPVPGSHESSPRAAGEAAFGSMRMRASGTEVGRREASGPVTFATMKKPSSDRI